LRDGVVGAFIPGAEDIETAVVFAGHVAVAVAVRVLLASMGVKENKVRLGTIRICLGSTGIGSQYGDDK
jgi:hypothetical protein